MSRITAAEFFQKYDVNHDNQISRTELQSIPSRVEDWYNVDAIDSAVVAKGMTLDARRTFFLELRPAFARRWDNGVTSDGKFVTKDAGDFFISVAEQEHGDVSERCKDDSSCTFWDDIPSGHDELIRWSPGELSFEQRRGVFARAERDGELMKLSYVVMPRIGPPDLLSRALAPPTGLAVLGLLVLSVL